MKYNFQENKLHHSFAEKNLEKIKQYINSGVSLNLVGIPGVGISNLLRFLANTDFAHFIYIDLLSLSLSTEEALYEKLAEELGISMHKKSLQTLLEIANKKLSELANKQKVVLVLNRFQKLQNAFSSQFFSHLRFLQSSNKENIIIIVTSNRPLFETNMSDLSGSNVTLFYTMFIKPYTKNDIQQLISLGPTNLRTKQELAAIEGFSGGHANLIQLLIRTEYYNHLLDDPFIALQLKTILSVFTKEELAQLRMIARGKNTQKINNFLLLSGMVDEKNRIFSPVLREYIQQQVALKLPRKESQLFYLLKRKINKLVTKDAIIETLWNDKSETTDRALNALMYRLRNNRYFKNSGFIIESHKGIGYRLIKN